MAISLNLFLNVNLKRIGDRLGIPNITFYAARHSYASNLNKANVPHSLIAQNMGRSPMEIETYLKAFEQSEILRANESAYITGQIGFKEGKKDKPIDEERQKVLREYQARKEKEEASARAAIIEEFGSVEAYEQAMKKRIMKLDEEMEEKFGDDTQAKIDYLNSLASKCPSK